MGNMHNMLSQYKEVTFEHVNFNFSMHHLALHGTYLTYT